MVQRRTRRDWLTPPEWWRRYRPLRILAVVLLAYGLWSWLGVGRQAVEVIRPPHPDTPAYTGVFAEPIVLLAPFASFDDLASIEQRLREAGLRWRTTRIDRPGSPERPPGSLTTVIVEDFSHLDVRGRLRLELFNDRLYEAEFVPADPEAYAPRLAAALEAAPRPRDNGRIELDRGALHVFSTVHLALAAVGRDAGITPRVIWRDRRLYAQLQDWDRRYAQAP